ncbi:MAG: toxin-antitoxin system YwqK family antitoxin [Lentimicrobium sp.]|nr:toxin-antitoxin system YwqK family antitoxin [Lentimicrobium sp.]
MKTPFYTLLACFSLFFMTTSCQREKIENFPNGKVKSVQNFKGKKQHGISTWYYENGKKQLETSYKEGELDGFAVRWFINGQKESSEQYKNGKRNGLSVSWNTSGVKTEERTYVNDTLHGAYRLYHHNEVLKIEGNYNHGLFDSIWTYYNEFGFKVGDARFEMGSGIQRAFHLNGKIWREIPFRSNKRNGTEKEYDNSGRLIKETTFENDVATGQIEY